MANYDVLKVDGSKSGSVELSDSVFAIEPNNSVLFEAINLQRASLRQGTHAVKIVQLYVVADVNHGDKRYRTCASRYNSCSTMAWWWYRIRTNTRSYAYKMPKKMRRLALRSALSFKVKENNFTIVDNFGFEAPKQKNSKMY